MSGDISLHSFLELDFVKSNRQRRILSVSSRFRRDVLQMLLSVLGFESYRYIFSHRCTHCLKSVICQCSCFVLQDCRVSFPGFGATAGDCQRAHHVCVQRGRLSVHFGYRWVSLIMMVRNGYAAHPRLVHKHRSCAIRTFRATLFSTCWVHVLSRIENCCSWPQCRLYLHFEHASLVYPTPIMCSPVL